MCFVGRSAVPTEQVNAPFFWLAVAPRGTPHKGPHRRLPTPDHP
jgi:hypothetical protein